MKKFWIGLLMLVGISASLDVIAQRRRVTATFDADTTRPTAGMYGITVIKKQPYLVGATGNAQRIEVSPLFIAARSFGTANKNVTLDTTVNHFYICGDSVTVTLPSKSQFNNKYGWNYYIHFLGYRGGADSTTKYTPYDNTYLLTFIDTIFFYNDANKTTYFTKTFTHDAIHRWWQITSARDIYLELRDNRWYLFYADIKF